MRALGIACFVGAAVLLCYAAVTGLHHAASRLRARPGAAWRRVRHRKPRHCGRLPARPPRPPWPAFMADPVPDHDPSELPPTWCDPGYVSPAVVTRYDLILPRSWRDGP